MTPRRTTLLEVVDRVVVTLVGLALVAAGAAVLAVALDLLEPPDLTGIAETALEQLEAWPVAAVIAVAAVVAILGAAFSIRHLLPAHQQRAVSELTLPSGEGRHRTEVRGQALSNVIEADLGRLPSVRSSSARLVSADPPTVDAKVTTSLACDLDELRGHVADVVERLEGALGRSDVRMRVRIGFLGASDSRVEQAGAAAGRLGCSPQDDHIDRVAYFERCFPTMDRLRRHELLHVTPTDGDDVFALYEYELTTGEVHRNAEVLTVRDGRIVEVQVFFGGRVDG